MNRLIGLCSTVAAFGVTFTHVEQVLRVLSAVVGIAIGIGTLVQMVNKRRRRRDE